MFLITSWLLLAYEIGLLFDELESFITQYTLQYALIYADDRLYKKGLEALINTEKDKFIEAIKTIDDTQLDIVKKDLIKESELTGINNLGEAKSLKELITKQVEQALQESYKKAIESKEALMRRIFDNKPENIAFKDFQAKREAIIDYIVKHRDLGDIMSYRTDIERDIRTTLQQENAKLVLDNVKSSNATIFYCFSHLQDCADDHAPYQDRLYIIKNYKESNFYKAHKEEVDKIVESQKPLILEDIIDGTTTFTYTLKNGEKRTRGVYLSTRYNCRHKPMPITMKQAMNLDETRKAFGDSMWTGNYDNSKYKALQKQRAIEREIRALKTRKAQLNTCLEYASNKAPIKQEIGYIKARMKQLDSELKETLTANNLPRVRTREQIKELTYTLGA